MGVTVGTKVNSAEQVKHEKILPLRICILIKMGVATKVSSVIKYLKNDRK